MEESVFAKIIAGVIPCHKIYEDDHTFAFLDIHPVQPGMVLVVSKRQVENFYDLEGEEYTALWQTVKLVAQKLHQVFPDKRRIGVQAEGLDVPHVHIKIFPVNSGDEFRAKPDMQSEPDQNELGQMAERIKF